MAKQAKCINCKIHYKWTREIKLSLLRCPKCLKPLKRTSHLLLYREVRFNKYNDKKLLNL